ncbi:MAG: VWA domain-containing protein [Pseudomonadota bacterium]
MKQLPLPITRQKLTVIAVSALLTACSLNTEQELASKEQERLKKQNTPTLSVPLPAQPAPVTLAEEDAVTEAEAVYEAYVAQSAAVRQEKAKLFASPAVGDMSIGIQPPTVERENYAHFDDNPLKLVIESPVSTFSIDVDTGSYANVRRFLNQGQMPRADAVRAEELINYFSYEYAKAENRVRPFSLNTELAVTPWNPNTHLLHIGIRGFEQQHAQLPPSNLVFLVDVSGSMNSPDKIGLLKSALKMLTRQMTAQDRIAIAVYAGAAGTVLEPTAGNNRAAIESALDRLAAGGSTNGAAGIRLAYQLAEKSFVEGGVNRVLIATDGDFNVGTTNFEALKELIERKRESGIALTTLGFGTGNYNDHLMEQLADVGNGNYAYIDTLKEAQKVLVDERAATLMTIAKDVKIQIEFNPAEVSDYRLIGYENRVLAREDFNNDKVDAGDIGAGHTITALYEITLTDSAKKHIDPLRYGDRQSSESRNDELAFLRLRYKQPEASDSRLIEQVISKASINPQWRSTSENFRFAASVAAFAQTLRGGKYLNDFDYSDIRQLASNARGADRFGYRGEFLQLLGLAESLDARVDAAQNDAIDNAG